MFDLDILFCLGAFSAFIIHYSWRFDRKGGTKSKKALLPTTPGLVAWLVNGFDIVSTFFYEYFSL